MAQTLSIFGLLLQLGSVVGFVLVLMHAFKRSLGTGVLVLLLPPYTVFYGFSQFEHPRKPAVLALWLGGLAAGIVFRLAGDSP